MKRRPSVAILVILLIMSHLWHTFFAGWTKEGVWIFVIDVLILAMIFLREWVFDFGLWLRNRQCQRIDETILVALSRSRTDAPVTIKTPEEISTLTGIKISKVTASLWRLKRLNHADVDAEGFWHKVGY